jgi:hypothetical protein
VTWPGWILPCARYGENQIVACTSRQNNTTGSEICIDNFSAGGEDNF